MRGPCEQELVTIPRANAPKPGVANILGLSWPGIRSRDARGPLDGFCTAPHRPTGGGKYSRIILARNPKPDRRGLVGLLYGSHRPLGVANLLGFS